MLAALLANRHFGGFPPGYVPGYTLPDGRRIRTEKWEEALEAYFESLLPPEPKKVTYTLPSTRSLKTTLKMQAWKPIPMADPKMSVPRRLTLTDMVSTKKTPKNRRLLGRFRLKGR